MRIHDRSGRRSHWGGETEEFVLELPTDVQVIEGAVGYLCSRCEEFAFEGSRLNLHFCVSVSEALTNAMLYGNGRDTSKIVRVAVRLDERQVSVTVSDEGNGFDPEAVPDPTLPSNLYRSGGRGVFLMRSLMDEVEYNERGNEVRMLLRRDPPLRRASSG